jgi:hypothetical protein
MADRTGLRLIGVVFASITCAIALVAILLVHHTVAGELQPDGYGLTVSTAR